MALSHRQQLSLDLSQPIDHHARLHGAGADGTVIYWERRETKGRWVKVKPDTPVQQLVSGFVGIPEIFLSANQFNGWRRVKLLKSLRACYVDVDGSDNLEEALEMLREARMPAPSFCVFTGRGMHLYWLLEPAPGTALPVWQRVQDALINALASIKADRAARDCTRMLRLVGSTHKKSGRDVRGVILTDQQWTIHELADEVLGHQESQRSNVHDLSATSARKGRAHSAKKWAGSIYGWWYLVYQDMLMISQHKWPGGVTPGHRDRVLFIMAVALSWYTAPETLYTEILATCKEITPTLKEAEVEASMSSVLKRAKQSADGEWHTYNGKQYDPRYNYSAKGLREFLADIIPSELHNQLRTLAPAEVIQQRKKERDAGRDRVAEGRYKQTREAYLQEHSGSAVQRAATARLLKAQGKTSTQIATEMGISRMSVSRYLRDEV